MNKAEFLFTLSLLNHEIDTSVKQLVLLSNIKSQDLSDYNKPLKKIIDNQEKLNSLELEYPEYLI